MDFNLTNFSSDTTKTDQKHVKTLVIGSGPAGLSAALYLARADLNPVVLAGMELGGQVSLTYTVENYPGFPDGVGGPELVELFQKQAERFGAVVEFDSATEVDLSQRPFRVQTYSTTYLADALIITTGATPRHLNIPGEVELTGRGVSYCATCDGWFFKEKDVVVVGGGDSALEEGIFLTRYARSVTIIHRRDELRGGAVLQKRAMENPRIKFLWNSIVTRVEGQDAVQSVQVQNVLTGEETQMRTDGLFIFIGHTPNTQLFAGQLEMDEAGYLVTDKYMRTNVPGVFAAGEVADPHFRQVITSAGMGAAAAMEANHFLDDDDSREADVVLKEFEAE
jgi:thioredoxin reductase (NADPH)